MKEELSKRSLESADNNEHDDNSESRRQAIHNMLPDKVVRSIDALLALETQKSAPSDDNLSPLKTLDKNVTLEQDERDFHVSVVSDFLVAYSHEKRDSYDDDDDDDDDDEACLECVQLLLMQESRASTDELQQACRFLLDPQYYDKESNTPWEPPLPHLVLWWELRAQIQRRLSIRQQQSSSFLLTSSDVIADTISSSAQVLERGLRGSLPYLDVGLEFTGNTIKRILTPHDDNDDTTTESSPSNNKKKLFRTPKDEVVTLTYADAASRLSSTVHKGAKTTVNTIRDASTDSIHYLCGEFERREMGSKLVPHPTHRHVLQAAGTVGLASVGAVCIVGEAAWDVTRQVAHKTAYVTADVIRYKYGDAAGTLVEHVSDTTGNVVRTAAHVAMLEKTVLAKIIAKNTVKVRVRRRRRNSAAGGDLEERDCESEGEDNSMYYAADDDDDDDDVKKVPPPRSKSL